MIYWEVPPSQVPWKTRESGNTVRGRGVFFFSGVTISYKRNNRNTKMKKKKDKKRDGSKAVGGWQWRGRMRR